MFQLPFPVRDANAASGSDQFGNLPEWDLTDLYTSEDAPELKRDLEWLETECSSFANDYEGKLANRRKDRWRKRYRIDLKYWRKEFITTKRILIESSPLDGCAAVESAPLCLGSGDGNLYSRLYA